MCQLRGIRSTQHNEYLVVLGKTFGTTRRAGLDLPGAKSHGEVRNVVVLGFPRAVRRHHPPPALLGQLHGRNRLRHRPDLVHLCFCCFVSEFRTGVMKRECSESDFRT